ncbi:hypothetical protein BH11PSE4_BH11PSE4_24780 [soil metagenome]
MLRLIWPDRSYQTDTTHTDRPPMSSVLEQIIAQSGTSALRLGAAQLNRLQQLTRDGAELVLWDGVSEVTATAALVLVLEAANAARLETLIGSLHENSVVVLPWSENPAFDALKSRLYPYGAIGAQGAAAPHHLWWGGVKPLAVRTGIYRKQDTLYVSGFVEKWPHEDAAALLAADLQRLGLSHAVEAHLPDIDPAARVATKIDFIIRQWAASSLPVFWLDPRARVHGLPLLPQSLGCDFAVHRRPGGEMNTGALYFGRTEAARALLDVWLRLARSHPHLPEAFLLDQAWTLACAQRQIETAWLPDAYWHAGTISPRDGSAIIRADAVSDPTGPLDRAASLLQTARKFGRHNAPEAHLIMKGPQDGHGPITVVIRDVLSAGGADVGGAIEAAASAFAADPGCFSQLEIVLCAWDDDVDSVMQIEDHSWVLMTDPSERLQAHAFRALSVSDDAVVLLQPSLTPFADIGSHARPVVRLVDAQPGDRPKRNGRYQSTILKRSAFVSAPLKVDLGQKSAFPED